MTSEAYWKQPLRWDREAAAAGRRLKVFCASLADVFEEWTGNILDAKGNVLWWAPGRGVISAGQTTPGLVRGERTATMNDLRAMLWELVYRTQNIDWLFLTKRVEIAFRLMVESGLYAVENPDLPCPQRNLWIGTSVENQERADERLPELLKIPAVVRFVSYEPALGPVDWRRWLGDGLSWIICGGESGPNRRPCEVEWFADTARQCQEAGVATFIKQDMGPKPGMQGRIPDELWALKQFPKVA